MTFQKVADVSVLVSIGIFVGLMIADASDAEHYIGEWQTLITGILAVVAASWTLAQMRASDRAQDERHRDLMRLSVRPDLLRIQRAAVPYAGYLRQFYADGFRLVQPGPDHLPTVAQQQRDAFLSAVNAAVYTFGRAEIGEVRPYLGPKASQTFSLDRERIIPSYEQALAHWKAQADAGSASAEETFSWVTTEAMTILSDGVELANSLDALLDMYRSGRIH
ncbi:MAG: hypothetical protein ACTHOP_14260 [Mesorhizobium sp.]